MGLESKLAQIVNETNNLHHHHESSLLDHILGILAWYLVNYDDVQDRGETMTLFSETMIPLIQRYVDLNRLNVTDSTHKRSQTRLKGATLGLICTTYGLPIVLEVLLAQGATVACQWKGQDCMRASLSDFTPPYIQFVTTMLRDAYRHYLSTTILELPPLIQALVNVSAKDMHCVDMSDFIPTPQPSIHRLECYVLLRSYHQVDLVTFPLGTKELVYPSYRDRITITYNPPLPCRHPSTRTALFQLFSFYRLTAFDHHFYRMILPLTAMAFHDALGSTTPKPTLSSVFLGVYLLFTSRIQHTRDLEQEEYRQVIDQVLKLFICTVNPHPSDNNTWLKKSLPVSPPLHQGGRLSSIPSSPCLLNLGHVGRPEINISNPNDPHGQVPFAMTCNDADELFSTPLTKKRSFPKSIGELHMDNPTQDQRSSQVIRSDGVSQFTSPLLQEIPSEYIAPSDEHVLSMIQGLHPTIVNLILEAYIMSPYVHYNCIVTIISYCFSLGITINQISIPHYVPKFTDSGCLLTRLLLVLNLFEKEPISHERTRPACKLGNPCLFPFGGCPIATNNTTGKILLIIFAQISSVFSYYNIWYADLLSPYPLSTAQTTIKTSDPYYHTSTDSHVHSHSDSHTTCITPRIAVDMSKRSCLSLTEFNKLQHNLTQDEAVELLSMLNGDIFERQLDAFCQLFPLLMFEGEGIGSVNQDSSNQTVNTWQQLMKTFTLNTGYGGLQFNRTNHRSYPFSPRLFTDFTVYGLDLGDTEVRPRFTSWTACMSHPILSSVVNHWVTPLILQSPHCQRTPEDVLAHFKLIDTSRQDTWYKMLAFIDELHLMVLQAPSHWFQSLYACRPTDAQLDRLIAMIQPLIQLSIATLQQCACILFIFSALASSPQHYHDGMVVFSEAMKKFTGYHSAICIEYPEKYDRHAQIEHKFKRVVLLPSPFMSQLTPFSLFNFSLRQPRLSSISFKLMSHMDLPSIINPTTTLSSPQNELSLLASVVFSSIGNELSPSLLLMMLQCIPAIDKSSGEPIGLMHPVDLFYTLSITFRLLCGFQYTILCEEEGHPAFGNHSNAPPYKITPLGGVSLMVVNLLYSLTSMMLVISERGYDYDHTAIPSLQAILELLFYASPEEYPTELSVIISNIDRFYSIYAPTMNNVDLFKIIPTRMPGPHPYGEAVSQYNYDHHPDHFQETQKHRFMPLALPAWEDYSHAFEILDLIDQLMPSFSFAFVFVFSQDEQEGYSLSPLTIPLYLRLIMMMNHHLTSKSSNKAAIPMSIYPDRNSRNSVMMVLGAVYKLQSKKCNRDKIAERIFTSSYPFMPSITRIASPHGVPTSTFTKEEEQEQELSPNPNPVPYIDGPSSSYLPLFNTLSSLYHDDPNDFYHKISHYSKLTKSSHDSSGSSEDASCSDDDTTCNGDGSYPDVDTEDNDKSSERPADESGGETNVRLKNEHKTDDNDDNNGTANTSTSSAWEIMTFTTPQHSIYANAFYYSDFTKDVWKRYTKYRKIYIQTKFTTLFAQYIGEANIDPHITPVLRDALNSPLLDLDLFSPQSIISMSPDAPSRDNSHEIDLVLTNPTIWLEENRPLLIDLMRSFQRMYPSTEYVFGNYIKKVIGNWAEYSQYHGKTNLSTIDNPLFFLVPPRESILLGRYTEALECSIQQSMKYHRKYYDFPDSVVSILPSTIHIGFALDGHVYGTHRNAHNITYQPTNSSDIVTQGGANSVCVTPLRTYSGLEYFSDAFNASLDNLECADFVSGIGCLFAESNEVVSPDFMPCIVYASMASIIPSAYCDAISRIWARALPQSVLLEKGENYKTNYSWRTIAKALIEHPLTTLSVLKMAQFWMTKGVPVLTSTGPKRGKTAAQDLTKYNLLFDFRPPHVQPKNLVLSHLMPHHIPRFTHPSIRKDMSSAHKRFFFYQQLMKHNGFSFHDKFPTITIAFALHFHALVRCSFFVNLESPSSTLADFVHSLRDVSLEQLLASRWQSTSRDEIGGDDSDRNRDDDNVDEQAQSTTPLPIPWGVIDKLRNRAIVSGTYHQKYKSTQPIDKSSQSNDFMYLQNEFLISDVFESNKIYISPMITLEFFQGQYSSVLSSDEWGKYCETSLKTSETMESILRSPYQINACDGDGTTGLLWFIVNYVSYPSIDDITTLLFESTSQSSLLMDDDTVVAVAALVDGDDNDNNVDNYLNNDDDDSFQDTTISFEHLNQYGEYPLMHALLHQWDANALIFLLQAMSPSFIANHRTNDGLRLIDYLKHAQLEDYAPEFTKLVCQITDEYAGIQEKKSILASPHHIME